VISDAIDDLCAVELKLESVQQLLLRRREQHIICRPSVDEIVKCLSLRVLQDRRQLVEQEEDRKDRREHNEKHQKQRFDKRRGISTALRRMSRKAMSAVGEAVDSLGDAQVAEFRARVSAPGECAGQRERQLAALQSASFSELRRIETDLARLTSEFEAVSDAKISDTARRASVSSANGGNWVTDRQCQLSRGNSLHFVPRSASTGTGVMLLGIGLGFLCHRAQTSKKPHRTVGRFLTGAALI
jgi:hypothetical protein